MMKTLSNIFKQDKEKFVIPRSVQQVIPIETIWSDGILKSGEINLHVLINLPILTMQWRAKLIRKPCSWNIWIY